MLNSFYLITTGFNPNQLTPFVAAVIVPIFLLILARSAQKESLKSAGSRSTSYSTALRVFVVLMWLFFVAFLGGVAISGGFESEFGDPKIAIGIGLLIVGQMCMHLEAFGVSITWDDQNIYTRSPWRARRTIPFTAVRSCDFSRDMNWYRIHTDGYGIIRLSTFMCGFKELLKELPCPSPLFPNNSRSR